MAKMKVVNEKTKKIVSEFEFDVKKDVLIWSVGDLESGFMPTVEEMQKLEASIKKTFIEGTDGIVPMSIFVPPFVKVTKIKMVGGDKK